MRLPLGDHAARPRRRDDSVTLCISPPSAAIVKSVSRRWTRAVKRIILPSDDHAGE